MVGCKQQGLLQQMDRGWAGGRRYVQRLTARMCDVQRLTARMCDGQRLTARTCGGQRHVRVAGNGTSLGGDAGVQAQGFRAEGSESEGKPETFQGRRTADIVRCMPSGRALTAHADVKWRAGGASLGRPPHFHTLFHVCVCVCACIGAPARPPLWVAQGAKAFGRPPRLPPSPPVLRIPCKMDH
eukprot:355222-Chlamydomonas_euryale.AAC.2